MTYLSYVTFLIVKQIKNKLSILMDHTNCMLPINQLKCTGIEANGHNLPYPTIIGNNHNIMLSIY